MKYTIGCLKKHNFSQGERLTINLDEMFQCYQTPSETSATIFAIANEIKKDLGQDNYWRLEVTGQDNLTNALMIAMSDL